MVVVLLLIENSYRRWVAHIFNAVLQNTVYHRIDICGRCTKLLLVYCYNYGIEVAIKQYYIFIDI